MRSIVRMGHLTPSQPSPRRGLQPTVHDLLGQLGTYHPHADRNLVQRAFVFAEQAHRPQRRKDGKPYIGHPVTVANLLAGLRLDVASICAGLLHDTVEDTDVTLDDLAEIFSPEIAELVDGVTKIGKIKFESTEEKQAENFRKMLMAMSKDIRVILVKLADRTHNMRTLGNMNPASQVRIAQETKDIYAPLANRLGLGATKSELEDLSFHYLYPDEFQALKAGVAQRLDERREFTGRLIAEIQRTLEAGGVQATVTGRPKHFWSIHQKMVRQRIPLEQVYDIIAFRIMVDRKKDCYEALGLIHDKWRPVPGRFKDYIGMPKPNGYQSLHTTMVGPEGRNIEVQIRTEAMHATAESGIAAHWKYKEGGRTLEPRAEERFDWLKRLMEWQRELDNPTEFLDSVKVELFSEEVYVFTPQGELKVLPRGSTPVDFAYSIHSEVGNHCAGALINGAIVPLTHQFSNGERCEIITNKNQNPNKDWMKFVKTSRAKNRIRSFIKKEQRARSLELGEQLLDKEFRRYSRSLARTRKTPEMEEVAKAHSLGTTEELIVQVGMGNLNADSIVTQILPAEITQRTKRPVAPAPGQGVLSRIIRKVTGAPGGIVVDGLEGVKHSIAKCCSPVPGEPIVGFVTPAHTVSVHRQGCVNASAMPVDRQVIVRWGEAEAGYPVTIQVNSESVPGLLNKMTQVFSDLDINIGSAQCAEVADGLASNIFRFRAKHVDEVKRVIRRMEALRGVSSAVRVRDSPGGG